MLLRSMLVVASATLCASGCSSTPEVYAPPLGSPDAPLRSSFLESSDPLLTVECRGDLDAGGEVCWTRAGRYVVHGVRNIVVMPEEAIVRFRQLVSQTQDELGGPPELASYIATPADTVPPFAGYNCALEAIRTSMPTIPLDSPEAAATANERRLCLHAKWVTGTEEVVVTLVPAMTSALDGPAVPEVGFAERYGLRIYRGTRDRDARAAYERARYSAVDAMYKSFKTPPPQ